MKKRVAAFAMAFLICLSLCACAEQIPVSPESAQERVRDDNTQYAALAALESVDCGGREFRIAAYDKSTVFGNGANSTMDLALEARNRKVEEKFNIKLTSSPASEGDLYANLLSASGKGASVCDIVVAPQSMMPYFYAGDMLLNVRALPFTDYSKPYFNRAGMNAASAGADTYAIFGEFTYTPTAYWALCYNQTLMDWFGFTDFVTLAKNGQWTWSLFNRYVQWFYKDVNYDRVMTDADRFGFTSSADSETLLKVLWASSGIEFFVNEPPALPQMSFDSQATQDMISVIQTALESPGRYAGDGAKSALQLFMDGQSLFYLCPVSSLGYLQLHGMNVGMLPLPKLYAEQENFYSYVDPGAQAVYVMNNCPDTDFVGRIIQALYAASADLVYNVTVSVYTAHHLTGNAAVNFFSEMIRHGYYDEGFMLGTSIPQFATASYRILEDVVFLGGDFYAHYNNNLTAFNDTFVNRSLHGKKTA